MADFLDLEKKYLFNVYTKKEIVLVRGENATLWDKDGKSYLDCVSGHGVSNLGHGNPRVTAAICDQAKRLVHCSNLFYNDQRARLLEKLVAISPPNLRRAYLCNSGAESMEAAIKFARFTTKKTDFICAENAFHGRTLGALSATFKPAYRTAFEPLVPGFSFVPFNDFERLKSRISDYTAGIILELIQGEGGIHCAEKEYIRQVRKLCDDHGILLIIDEIQSGFCRTGKMFACEYYGLEPDMLCLAKAMAGGLPMGAVVCADKIDVPVGKHGTTFGGNPLCCAAASTTIDVMLEENLAEQATEKGAYLKQKLHDENLSKVTEIRGLGLMLGVEVKEDAKPIMLRLIDDGLLTFPAGISTIRVFPPLTISYPELERVAAKLVNALK